MPERQTPGGSEIHIAITVLGIAVSQFGALLGPIGMNIVIPQGTKQTVHIVQ
jgi:hypothetical protein